MKRCACCGEMKPRASFSRASTSADGLQSWCKACKASDQVKRYHRDIEIQRERSRLRMRARRAADPDRERAYIERWRVENADRVRLADAARRKAPERKAWQAAYWREWKRLNRTRAREIARKGQQTRRARKMGAFVEVIDPMVVLDRGQGICGICGGPVDPDDFHVDHVQPLALGGEHSYANTQPAHPSCNLAKGRGTRDELAALRVEALA